MPLSKARDRERKKGERAKIRLDKLISSPQFAMHLREQKVKPIRYCEACGYSETVDRHHEGEDVHILCPNCHGLITRGIRTLGQLCPPQTPKPVQPKQPYETVIATPFFDRNWKPELDADGNAIPEM